MTTIKKNTIKNNTSRRALILGLVLLLLASIPIAAFAHQDGRSGGGIVSFLMERATERLDLSEVQREEIRAILESHRDELREEIGAVVDARRGLFAAIHGESFDEPAIRAASERASEAQLELAMTRGKIVQELRAALTPEQQAKAQELLERLSERLSRLVDERL